MDADILTAIWFECKDLPDIRVHFYKPSRFIVTIQIAAIPLSTPRPYDTQD